MSRWPAVAPRESSTTTSETSAASPERLASTRTKARGSAAALVSAGEQVPCDLGAIIVTISAYEDSNSRWQADRTLATIQSAVTAANYTLERFHLPRSGSGDDKEEGVHRSGCTARSGRVAVPACRGCGSRRVAVATT